MTREGVSSYKLINIKETKIKTEKSSYKTNRFCKEQLKYRSKFITIRRIL